MKKTKENKHSFHFDAYSPVICNNTNIFTPLKEKHMFNMAAQQCNLSKC